MEVSVQIQSDRVQTGSGRVSRCSSPGRCDSRWAKATPAQTRTRDGSRLSFIEAFRRAGGGCPPPTNTLMAIPATVVPQYTLKPHGLVRSHQNNMNPNINLNGNEERIDREKGLPIRRRGRRLGGFRRLSDKLNAWGLFAAYRGVQGWSPFLLRWPEMRVTSVNRWRRRR